MDKVSVIIPSFRSQSNILNVLEAIENQTHIPNEVLIIDNEHSILSKFLKKKEYSFSLNILEYSGKNFPPNKRNYGVKNSKNEIIAFLDVKTIPDKSWLEKGTKKINNYHNLVIFGSTKYYFKTLFQKILFFCSYGNKNYETLPGTILSKKNFYKVGNFIENVRAGEDIEWRNRVKKFINTFYSKEKNNLTYKDLPKDILELQKKYILYSFYNAFVDVQQNIKNFYLFIFLVLSFIIVPKWNYLIGNWVSNPLYIPNITKKYIIIIIILYLLFILFKYFLKNIKKYSYFYTFYSYFVLFLIFTSIFYWNEKVAHWAEESVWYIPHITKIFVISLILFSILFRGVIKPIRNGVNIKHLMPVNWLFCGMLGLYLDIIKAPCYLLGGILYPFLRSK